VNYFVGCAGYDVLFGHRLEAVCDWLQNPEWADPVRAIAILYSAEPLALENSCEGKKGGENAYDSGNGYQC
jgi:hypothetical protein